MNHDLKCNCKLAEVMRSVVPVEGIDFKNLIMVELEPGERIGRHKHAYHTVLHYPADAAPITIEPTAGMIIYLPPGTQHEVPRVSKNRVSVAMLVEPQKATK